MAYESFVGRRYLMAKQRSRVVSIITLIAVAGVALGVTALIVVLSVMGGFTEDLTQKILGARAHIVLQDPDYGQLDKADEYADRALEYDGVVGASPFIEGEVMVSSRTNLNGVILRGIDGDRVAGVSDLLSELEEGDLRYLRDDSELMEKVEAEDRRDLDDLLERLDRQEGMPVDEPGDDEELPALPEFDDNGDDPASGSQPPSPSPSPSPSPLPGFDAEEESVEEGAPGGMPPLFEEDGQRDLPALPSLDEDPEGESEEETTGGLSGASERDGEGRMRVPGLVIGTELANSLQVRLGDEINVVTPRGEMGPTGPIPSSRPFRIVGVFYSGMYEYDANHVYTDLADAGRLLGYEGATGVELRVEDVDDSVSIANRIRADLAPEIDVLDWQELNSSLFFALRLERIAMFVVLTFIILVASFSIVAMLIMIVIEKAREIAILKSMGATNAGIMRIFIYQGVVIGVFGALVGLGAGLGICHYLATVGLPLDSEVYYIDQLPVNVNPREVAAVVTAAMAISFLATLYPSYQAAKLNPVEGLSYD